MWQVIIAGFSIGLISSFHCVGMCGPLALALPVNGFSASRRFISIMLYNLGRVVTYTSLGILFGWMGRGIYLAGLQQAFSIALGLASILFLYLYLVKKQAYQPPFMKRFYGQVQVYIARFLGARGKAGFLLLGMANGLLPCAMVYIAIAAALTAGSTLKGAVLMSAFGLATLPAMLLLSIFKFYINMQVRNTIRKLVPVYIALIAVLLILRGLNLGIPFISPVLPGMPRAAIHCW